MGDADLFLIVLAAAVVWVVRAYLWPYANCRRCQGAKVNKGSTAKRYGLCKKCGGSGARQVLGARAVHKAVTSVIAVRNKRKDQ